MPLYSDSQKLAKDLMSIGTQVKLAGKFPKELAFENPISLRGVFLHGRIHIGQFSYVGRQSEIRDAQIGRYCSFARNVVVGVAEHPTDYLSSHPFAFGRDSGFSANPYMQELLKGRSQPF